MKASQVKKTAESNKPLDITTKHRIFNVGEQVRLQSVDSEGRYETGRIVERIENYKEEVSHYVIALDSDPDKEIKVSVWFVKGMDSPEKLVR